MPASADIRSAAILLELVVEDVDEEEDPAPTLELVEELDELPAAPLLLDEELFEPDEEMLELEGRLSDEGLPDEVLVELEAELEELEVLEELEELEELQELDELEELEELEDPRIEPLELAPDVDESSDLPPHPANKTSIKPPRQSFFNTQDSPFLPLRNQGTQHQNLNLTPLSGRRIPSYTKDARLYVTPLGVGILPTNPHFYASGLRPALKPRPHDTLPNTTNCASESADPRRYMPHPKTSSNLNRDSATPWPDHRLTGLLQNSHQRHIGASPQHQ